MWNWLQTNQPTVTAVASIVGPLLTFGALILSVHQLSLTQASFQNNLIYTMQKDEQTIAAEFLGGKTADTAAIFAQMQAVFLQRRLGSIPDDVWSVFEQDFCGTMASQRLRRDWESINKSTLSKEFVSYVETITKQNSQVCGGKP